MSKAKTIKKYQGNGAVLVSSSASIALLSHCAISQLLGEVWLIASWESQKEKTPF
nr:hypothetical protein [Evansella caseinilytica]